SDTAKNIVKILRRYDICLLQEVREADTNLSPDGSSPLLTKLIDKVSTKTKTYSGVLSPQIGRGSYKEKYIFLYRSDLFKFVESHLFDDNNFGDVFEREPFSARFSLISKPDFHVAILGIHVKPSDAVKEIGSLHHCFEQLSIQWSPRDEVKPEKKPAKKWYHYLFSCICPTIFQGQDEAVSAELGAMNRAKLIGPIIMGDLNAGKNYVSDKAKNQIELYANKEKYLWLIGDDVDTTVAKSTNYPYDRIIVPAAQSIHFRDAKPFLFDTKLKLDTEMALAISDHYPVEVQLII
ncbi:Deoxyribonuclease-1, partial [Massospora cicadina]